MPECYADTLLIEILVPSKGGYNHKFGCFNVEAEMKSGKLKDQFAVGIIDKDKSQIEYLAEFDEIDKVEGSLILWRHDNKLKALFRDISLKNHNVSVRKLIIWITTLKEQNYKVDINQLTNG
jgi:hypothetical protein